MSKNKIENLTIAYIHSYNTAMTEVKNPEFANQISMNVIFVISATEPKQKQETVNPLKMLFQHITENAQEQEEENNE